MRLQLRMSDLATTDEVNEVKAITKFNAPNHNPLCQHKHTVLRYAFTQRGFGSIPNMLYWHVISEGKSHHSTLSLEGLKEWGLIR